MSDRFAKALDGDEILGAKELVDYLVSAYDVTEERAAEILQAHPDMIQEGRIHGSFIYYIGDAIANEEALEPHEHEDEDEAFEADET